MSPKIYEYKGIVLKFYSEEHLPIHVHAFYGDCEVSVSFSIKEGKITRTTYNVLSKNFPEKKLKDLKAFISVYKHEIIDKWIYYFIGNGSKTTFKKITKL